MKRTAFLWTFGLAAAGCALLSGANALTICSHKAVFDNQGILQSWAPWEDILDREMQWYLKCPVEHGYPRFVTLTFMDGNYQPVERRRDFIPAMQNGMGIISYLKYYALRGKKDAGVLDMARSMGDFLVRESLTPDNGKWPRYTRSTGLRGKFPLPPDAGSQADKPYEIEPDKGGIAGFGLMLLYEETQERRYLDQALQNAKVLAANMVEGTAERSPWPFRVDYRSGDSRGPACGNQSFNLRLFDKLIANGHNEFREPREKLWSWIRNFQIPNARKNGLLWVNFFEDHAEPDNRISWSPMNLARYLLEKKDDLDPHWLEDAATLVEFTSRRFAAIFHGVPTCGEQDYDRDPWGGASSTYAAVMAMYAQVTGSPSHKLAAYQAMNLCLYAVDEDGGPRDGVWKTGRGGWQEDSHTDVVHNVIDAILAFRKMK